MHSPMHSKSVRVLVLCGILLPLQDALLNSQLGDKASVSHDYDVLLMHLIENFDPFSLCDTDKPEQVLRWEAVTAKTHHRAHHASTCQCVLSPPLTALHTRNTHHTCVHKRAPQAQRCNRRR
jgi:hypothetical protein